MGRAKKMSREELLLSKRLRERERYNKMKNDPVQKELIKEKEEKKYENKKKRNKVNSLKIRFQEKKKTSQKKMKILR